MNQGLIQEEFEWMEKMKTAADLHWDDLSPWEHAFLENRLEDFQKYGIKTRISRDQWKILHRISDKIF